MGLFDKLEKRLESGVNNAFAKAFRAEVQPVELASAVRRAMDDRATSVGKGKRPIVPNLFDVELSPTDFEQLTEYEAALVDELKASAAEHAETQRYTPGGPLTINFSENEELETGVFKVRPQIARQVAEAEPSHGAAFWDDPQPEPQFEQHEQPEPAAFPKPRGFALPGRRSAEAPAEVQPDVYNAPTDDADEFTGQQDDHDDSTWHGNQQHESRWDAATHERSQPEQRWEAATHERSLPDDPEPEHDQPWHAPQEQPRAQQPLRPSPAAPRSYRQRPQLDIDGDLYPLLGAITVIGRDDDVDVVLDDSGVSRRHSEIRVTNDGPHLVASLSDLGSTNGTFLNGERITSVRLNDGDRITVGRTSMIFRSGSRR